MNEHNDLCVYLGDHIYHKTTVPCEQKRCGKTCFAQVTPGRGNLSGGQIGDHKTDAFGKLGPWAAHFCNILVIFVIFCNFFVIFCNFFVILVFPDEKCILSFAQVTPNARSSSPGNGVT